MNTQRSTEIRVGVVSVLAFILLIVGIMLGRGCSVGASHVLSFRFPSSGSIDISAPVTVNGVRRGTVSSVQNSDGGVLVTATLQDISDLRTDASAVITMLEITGGKKIEITPGKASQQLDPAMVIAGRSEADISELLTMVGDLGESAGQVLRRVDTLTGTLNAALADGKIINNARQSMENLNSLLGSANELVTSNRAVLQQTINDVHALVVQLRTTVDNNAPVVDSIITQLNKTLAKADKTVTSVDRVVGNADELIGEVHGLVKDIKTSNGFAGKLIYDTQFSNRLDSTLTRLQGFLYKIDEHGINVNLRLGTRP